MTDSLAPFLGQILARCAFLRSLWMIGARADGAPQQAPFRWDLLGFGDARTLQQLRHATELHRPDVQFRVVLDGDRFQVAWGLKQDYGSLFEWAWQPVSAAEAYYDEAVWAAPVEDRIVERIRRKAVRLWERSAPAIPGSC
jgi:hypothetical protein